MLGGNRLYDLDRLDLSVASTLAAPVLDERFFGTLIAYVPGAQASAFDFTSGLPVQLLKVMAPMLMPLINGGAGVTVLKII